jgi:hypothetical protein
MRKKAADFSLAETYEKARFRKNRKDIIGLIKGQTNIKQERRLTLAYFHRSW